MVMGLCSITGYSKPIIENQLDKIKNRYITGEINLFTLEDAIENQILSERI